MDRKVKDDALRRLSIAQGHLEKVKNMLEENAYCPDVIHQSHAVQAALKKADEIILQGHLQSCVLPSVNEKNTEKLVDEVMELFRKNQQ